MTEHTSLGQSEPRRWTLYINEQGSMVDHWYPGVEVVEVVEALVDADAESVARPPSRGQSES